MKWGKTSMIADFSLQGRADIAADALVRDVRHLPSSPRILPHLKRLLSDANSAMDEIVSLIRLDVGIAARVLQVANSVFFSKGARCQTVEEAVSRVGYAEIYDLVSYAVASQVLVRPLGVYGMEADELWKVSVAGALAAEMLAGRTGQERAAAYTAGLLHCVGMVAIDEWALRHARGLTLKHLGFPREATESERAFFGFTQAEAGAALMNQWEYPSTITEPVRWQYAPRASGDQARMASLLYAAKWLRSTVCSSEAVPLPESIHLQPLGLGSATLRSMVPELERKLVAVRSLLDQTFSEADSPDQTPTNQRFPLRDWNRVR